MHCCKREKYACQSQRIVTAPPHEANVRFRGTDVWQSSLQLAFMPIKMAHDDETDPINIH
jgi:hypothetical protein